MRQTDCWRLECRGESAALRNQCKSRLERRDILLTKLKERLRRSRLFKAYTVAIAFDETNGVFMVSYCCNE